MAAGNGGMIHLVVFAGQSNAGGYRMTAETLPAMLAGFDYGKTYIWGGANGVAAWLPLRPAQNTGDLDYPQSWGPELAFAQAFREAHPNDTLLIIKQTSGTTGLARDPDAADWSPESRRELFDFMSLTIGRAQRGYADWTGEAAPKVSAVFWMQGEEDATDAAKAAAYEGNLAAFLARARVDWMHDPDGKFLAGRISDSTLLPHRALVREAQWRLDQDDPGLATFRTLDYPLQPDQIHYAPEGYLEMGRDAYRLWDDWF